MGCLHDPANVQQTSSKCIQNARANAGRLLEVCWKFVGSCKHPITEMFDDADEKLFSRVLSNDHRVVQQYISEQVCT